MKKRLAMILLTVLALAMCATPASAEWLTGVKPGAGPTWIQELSNPVVGSWNVDDNRVDFLANGEVNIESAYDIQQKAHYWFADGLLIMLVGRGENRTPPDFAFFRYVPIDNDSMELAEFAEGQAAHVRFSEARSASF